MEPTIAEVAFWITGAVIAIGIAVILCLPWNSEFDPKGDDPYRYCPKEEDE
jgi:hypothetical protein